MKSPTRTPTLEDVAKVAGVSRATVSRVINGQASVDLSLQRKVLAAVDEIGYRPNSAARQLAGRRTGVLALVLSGSDGSAEEVLSDPFFGRITGGVVKHLRTKGKHPTLFLADSEATRLEAVDHVRRGDSDGALLVSTHADDILPGLFVEAGLPAVLFARPALHAPISYVDLAHEVGAALAADRLVSRGCHKVVTIAGPTDVPAAQDRLTGFRQGMARHGQPHIPVAYGNFTQDSGETAMLQLLARVPDLDGVFAANDLMAAGALRALRDAGRPVPTEVAVIGFDDSAPASTAVPPLTTIAQPLEEMAAEMSRLLVDQIESPGQAPQCTIFDPHLVERDSA